MVWVLKRQAARVVLINDRREVYCIESLDPADPSKGTWWEIPGGGLDPGEPSAVAVARELHEEAGITDAEIGPVVVTQHVEFEFGGYHFDQDEVIHVARTAETELHRPQGLEYLEALAFQGARWWPVDELAASDATFLPPWLPEVVERLAAGDLPEPPWDMTERMKQG